MAVHVRRDHSLRVPRPDLSDAAESPSACAAAGCHADRSTSWIATAFVAMYGDRSRPPRWGPVLAAGRAGQPAAEQPLAELARDEARPAIVRASALELLGGYSGSAGRRALEQSLDDPDPLVRATAASHVGAATEEHLVELLAPLCRDSIRAVRVAAAERLAGLAPDGACAGALDEAVAA